MMTNQIGPCVEGHNCINPRLELRNEHKCPECKQIVHIVCGVFDVPSDKYYCTNCYKNLGDQATESEDDSVVIPLSCDGDDDANRNPVRDVVYSDNGDESHENASALTPDMIVGNLKIIPKDYFLLMIRNKNNQLRQKVNVEMQTKDTEWKRLKREVTREIANELQLMIIIHAQEIDLHMTVRGKPRKVQKFSEVGQCWADDGSIQNASKINRVMNTQFEESHAYECYMETVVMKKIGLQYDCSNPKKKGCIARMITRKRSDMFKVVNKRSENSHQKKISTNRISAEGNEEEQKKNIGDQGKPFQIVGEGWYTPDGSVYDNEEASSQSQDPYYQRTIMKLQSELKKKTKELREKTSKEGQMARSFRDSVKDHDREMMKDNGRVLKDIVASIVQPKKKKGKEKKKKKRVIKRKSSAEESDEDTAPLSAYMKKVIEKREQNAVVLSKIVQEKNKRFPKGKKAITKKKITKGKQKCVHDHNFYSGGYKEEPDKRYCKEDMGLHNTICKSCKKRFSHDVKDNQITPSISRPIYICIGRNKYSCKHGFCYDCYNIKVAGNNERGIMGRRCSRRKIT